MAEWSQEREHPRVGFDLPVKVELVGGEHTATIVDISEQGLRYVRPRGVAPFEDREVLLEFRLPGDDEVIRVLGCIAGLKDAGDERQVSITFFSLPEPDRDRIRRYVR